MHPRSPSAFPRIGRGIGLLLLVALLGSAVREGSIAAAAPDPGTDASSLVAGSLQEVSLSRRSPRRRFVFDAPPGTTRIDLVVCAHDRSIDVDVFLRWGRPFALDPVREADLSGRTEEGVEFVAIEGPLATGRWYVWIELEEPYTPVDASVFLRFAPGPHADVVLPGEVRPLVAAREQTRGWHGRLLGVEPPRGAQARLRRLTSDARGDRRVEAAPRLELELRGATDVGSSHEVLGASGDGGASRDDTSMAEGPLAVLAWRIARPTEGPGSRIEDDIAYGVEFAYSLGGVRPSRQDRDPYGVPTFKDRVRVVTQGSRTVSFDVPDGTRSVRVTATPRPAADVELFLRVGKPADAEAGDADWFALSIDEVETIVAGGDGVLPAGRYYLTVEVLSSEEDVRVEIETTFDATDPSRPIPTPQRLEPARFHADRIDPAERAFRWYRIDVPEGATAVGAQIWNATGPLDLVFARPNDGGLIARSMSAAADERLVWNWGAPLAVSRPLWLGVLARDPYEEEATFQVAWSPESAPIPSLPEGWPAAGRRRDGNPMPRNQAGCVEITLDDGSGGSGACVSPRGLILTCRHVLELDDSDDLQRDGILVAFPLRSDRPPSYAFRAYLLAEDEDLDLALLRIDEDVFGRPFEPTNVRPYLELGSTDGLDLGDIVTVYGYPADGSERSRTPLTLTRGVIAGLEAGADGGLRWIKTDAWIGSGHSGGVLADGEGRLIAVPTATLGDLESVGLAVPISLLPAAWMERIREDR